MFTSTCCFYHSQGITGGRLEDRPNVGHRGRHKPLRPRRAVRQRRKIGSQVQICLCRRRSCRCQGSWPFKGTIIDRLRLDERALVLAGQLWKGVANGSCVCDCGSIARGDRFLTDVLAVAAATTTTAVEDTTAAIERRRRRSVSLPVTLLQLVLRRRRFVLGPFFPLLFFRYFCEAAQVFCRPEKRKVKIRNEI